ncbi:hypothetical protein HMPREF1022_00908 [Desulfovibrio sp. 6_1_46AFAA]|uniref:hypothetical protein n=1 Tax=Desulfovibrio sp. 6_1_46AFAA TaxID=665942 RepID=UPI0002237180|nr:hypothetical protein [Desulfovibrio sp. 6_1_46AFAA]EGW52125.1 hypothetical protein HMPREF1022_00908 [Desulfovibrio sp. 6_1_46AFAA]
MPSNTQRFILRRTQADAWLIRDNKDGSVVCFVHKGRRAPEKTQAMVKVMLDALNAAAQLQRTKENTQC